jgi:4-amino-4-deoxy-L-arabinose transferase-like glycosyltransferase
MDISPATGMRLLEGLFVIVSGVLVSVVRMRFFSWKVALLASALWSTYPFHLWLTKQPDPSTLFSVLLLASALLFFVWSAEGRNAGLYGVLLGLILGITALIKPFAIGLPVVFASLACICPITSHRRSRILFSSCILLAYALAVLPWEIWAWRVGGHWIPLCTNGANAAIDGLTFGTERGLPQVAMPKAARTLVADAAAHYPQLKSTSSIRRFVLTKVRESPGAVLELLLVKAGRSWFGNESHTFERWIAIVQLFYLPFIILGGRSVWKHGGTQQKWFFVVSITMILYFWMMTTLVVFAILRYMVPVVCLLMVLVAVSLQVLATSVFHTKSGYRH